MAAVSPALLGALVLAVGVWLAFPAVRRVGAAGLPTPGRRWPGPSRRADRRVTETSALEPCEAIAGDLRAGATAEVALERAAEEWPALAPVARAVHLGADVPAAWRAVSLRPGCGDLAVVAAAWQVSQHSGGALARAMTSVAGRLRRLQASRRIVAAELASAHATARLMAGLPLLAWAMGSGVGGNPVAFLAAPPWGWGCLVLGLGLNGLGLWWIRRIADGIEGSR